MISRKTTKILLIMGIIVILTVLIFGGVCTVIANSVISEMADVRVEKNDATLADFGLIGEQISVTSSDGLKINAYVVPNQQSRGNVLILHGMHGMDATSLFDYAKFIYEAGYTPVAIDMRAHGKSEGESLSFGYQEPLDVIAVIDYLKADSRFNQQPIIIYGLSMGGSTAINTAAMSADVDGIIAVSPFLSIQSQIRDYMLRDGAPSAFVSAFSPFVNLVLWNKYDVTRKESPEFLVQTIPDIPVLIIHGDNDTQTALYQGEALYDKCSSRHKEFWLVAGKDHLIVSDVLADDSQYYRDRIVQFLDTEFDSNDCICD